MDLIGKEKHKHWKNAEILSDNYKAAIFVIEFLFGVLYCEQYVVLYQARSRSQIP